MSTTISQAHPTAQYEGQHNLSGLKQCLELLKGPTDERRFVGLLLAAKTLPTGNIEAIHAVYDAVGAAFFRRILLPLQSGQVAPQDEEKVQKTAATCALGLAILSSLCQSPEIAKSQDMIEKVPLFVKVVRQNGLTAVLKAEVSTKELLETDAAAAQDALECLAAVTSASREGRQVARQSSALQAVSSALQHGPSSKQWAVRLLISLLDVPDRLSVLLEHKALVARVVPPLGSLLGELGSSAQKGKGSAAAHADPAADQLDILHALLLLLPPPEELSIEGELRAAAAGGTADWTVAARAGLHLLLLGRKGPVQQQAVLRLVAAFMQIMPPAWLLGGINPAFFTILIELVKVEIILLLRDALSPESFIPAVWQTSACKPQQDSSADSAAASTVSSSAHADTGMAEPSTRDGKEGAEGSEISPLEEHFLGESPLQRMAQDSRRVDKMSAPTPLQGKINEQAGERAARNLPSLLQLFEACIEALAATEEQDNLSQEERPSKPSLPSQVAERAMSSLREAADALLQFLEELKAQGRNDLMATAATRALGRFLADAPTFEETRVRAVLPWLATLQNGAALPYLVPLLLQTAAPDGASSQREAWVAAARSEEVLQPLVQRLAGLTQEADAQEALYNTCAVFASIADMRNVPPNDKDGEALLATSLLQATRVLSAWCELMFKQQELQSASSIVSPSIEPRLLAYAGRICGLGLAVGHSADKLTSQEAASASRCVLLALEVGEVVLSLNERACSATAAPMNLSSLKIDEGVQHEDKDFAQEVREHWVATLEVAAGLLKTSAAFEEAALKAPWCNKVAETVGDTDSKALKTFKKAFQALA